MAAPALKEEEMEGLFERMKYRDLLSHKVDVTSPCTYCRGEGEKDGETCPVCQGEKTITQHMPLLKVAKMMMPFILEQIVKTAQAAQDAS